MRALASPASLKGALSALDAASSLAEGFRRAGLECDECPVADGGEGTLDVLQASLGGSRRLETVSDPLGRPVTAAWLQLPDGRAIVEAAQAIGLGLGDGDPLRASSRGLGELITAVGDRELVVTLGGVATVDGGAGLLSVVERLPRGTVVACDVSTRLGDAVRLYGPQKGADAAAVAELERRLASRPELQPFAELAGSGAAGGLGAALASLGATLVEGATFVLTLVDFPAQAKGATVVVTGEGTIDKTTREGKAPFVVLRTCRALGVRCVVFGGRVRERLESAETSELSGDPARAAADLVSLGSRIGAEMKRSAD